MKKVINIPTIGWTPTIVKVENGYIVSMLTPAQNMNITEVYIYKTWEELVGFLAENFGEPE